MYSTYTGLWELHNMVHVLTRIAFLVSRLPRDQLTNNYFLPNHEKCETVRSSMVFVIGILGFST